MQREPKQHERNDKGPPSPRSIPGTGMRLLAIIFVASGLLHIASLVSLHKIPQLPPQKSVRPLTSKSSVRIKVKPAPQLAQKKNKDAEKDKQTPAPKKIVEAQQEETAPPTQADFLGYQNHQTKKQTKLAKNKIPQTKAADPGAAAPKAASKVPPKAGSELAKAQAPAPDLAKQAEKKPVADKKQMSKQASRVKLKQDDASGMAVLQAAAPRNAYEKLLHSGANQMQGQVQAGYQDYLDEDLEEGDAIDLNTQEYRYIGYFTSMRKAIELVWNYPSEAARRGLHGKVSVKFTIQNDGKVSRIVVLNSSGHQVLDHAIVDAIKLAAPFAPLPNGFGSEHLNVTGTFNYVLN